MDDDSVKILGIQCSFCDNGPFIELSSNRCMRCGRYDTFILRNLTDEEFRKIIEDKAYFNAQMAIGDLTAQQRILLRNLIDGWIEADSSRG